MLRNLIASMYLLVLQYKEGIVLHSICNDKTRPFVGCFFFFFKKGSPNEMFSVFLYLTLKEYLAIKKTLPFAFCFSSKFDTLILLLSVLSFGCY